MRRYSLIQEVKFVDGTISFYLTTYQTNRKLLDAIRQQSTYYVVQTGERIETIAKNFLGDEQDWIALAILNDMVNPWDEVYPGRKIFIPPSVESIAGLISYWQKGENNIHTLTTKFRLNDSEK